MNPSLAVTIILALLCGCSPKGKSLETCVRTSLNNSGLRHGVARLSDREGSAVTVTSSWIGWWRSRMGHRVRAASLTKPMTAHLAIEIAERENLSLDTRLPQLFQQAQIHSGRRATTLRQLLDHTGDAPGTANADPLFEYGGNCDAAATRWIASEPRGPAKVVPNILYSNVGYCTVGLWLSERGAGAPWLKQHLGAAGGFKGTIQELYDSLVATLPLTERSSSAGAMADGSRYTSGWRYWPDDRWGMRWTHTGRLPGLLAVAGTDGRHRLILAVFEGDPLDYQAVAHTFLRRVSACAADR